MFIFATYNTKDYLRDAAAERRAPLVEQVVRDLGAHAIALQELPGQNPKRAAEGLHRLAHATGMDYLMPAHNGGGSHPAFAIGHDDLSVALLWDPNVVRPVPGTLRAYKNNLWHALVVGEFDVGEERLAIASSQGPPSAGRGQRTADAMLVGRLLGGYNAVLLGHDRNCVGADRKPDGTYYDPDPYQPNARPKDNGELPETAHLTDRSPAVALTTAGFIDIAPYIGAPWEPTTGHWPGERNGDRRIDEIRANLQIAQRAIAYEVVQTGTAIAASDHLPIKATFMIH